MRLIVAVLTQQYGIRTWIRRASFALVVASIIVVLESLGAQTTTTETTTVNITYLEESQSKCYLAQISQLLPPEDYLENKVAVHSQCCLDDNEIPQSSQLLSLRKLEVETSTLLQIPFRTFFPDKLQENLDFFVFIGGTQCVRPRQESLSARQTHQCPAVHPKA